MAFAIESTREVVNAKGVEKFKHVHQNAKSVDILVKVDLSGT